MLCHNIIQALVVLGNVVDIAIFSDGCEVATGTVIMLSSKQRALEVIAFLRAITATFFGLQRLLLHRLYHLPDECNFVFGCIVVVYLTN